MEKWEFREVFVVGPYLHEKGENLVDVLNAFREDGWEPLRFTAVLTKIGSLEIKTGERVLLKRRKT